jgi:PTS system mannitol-specific IIC component
MKPKLIAATILGGMTGIFINVLFGSGLRAPAAPGSIIAVLAQTASDSYLGVVLSVIGAAGVSFLVASLLLKTDRADAEPDLAAATAEMQAMKGKPSAVVAGLTGGAAPISSIVFACDAGMGSSAMGASVLRKKIHGSGFADVKVTNQSIANLTDTYGMVVSHRDLTERARQKTPSALHVSVDDFMNSPRYDEIVELLGRANSAPAAPAVPAAIAAPVATAAVAEKSHPQGEVLGADSIVLSGAATTRDGAIAEAGQLLVACGAVDPSYVDAMFDREASVSTYMGNGLAIPHGTNEAKGAIRRTAMSFVRYPEPIDWNGKPAEFVVGIAGAGQDHMALLTQIAHSFLDSDAVTRLREARTAAEIQAVLSAQ